ncbi:MAG: chemotaxis protein CheD [Pseudomonadota bacterium]
MGEGVVLKAPSVISVEALGSCVALALYDINRRIGGIAHIMLPNSDNGNIPCTPYQCADTAMTTLLEELRNAGAHIQDIVAKMVGGSCMFAFDNSIGKRIGEDNIMSIMHLLKREGIPLTGKDIGGNYGRSVEFHLNSGRLIVRGFGIKEREI